MNKTFSEAIATRGCRRRFRSTSEKDTVVNTLDDPEIADSQASSSTDGPYTPASPNGVAKKYGFHEYSELRTTVSSPISLPARPEGNIMQWISR